MRYFAFFCIALAIQCVFYTSDTPQFWTRHISEAQWPHVASGVHHGPSSSEQSQKWFILSWQKRGRNSNLPCVFSVHHKIYVRISAGARFCFSTHVESLSTPVVLVQHNTEDYGPRRSLSMHNPDPFSSHCGPWLHPAPTHSFLPSVSSLVSQ